MTVTPLKVARAIARANPLAGQSYDAAEQQTVEVRARNLIADHEWGPFIVSAKNDRGEWAPGADVVIYMEPRGGDGDCCPPLDYYGGGYEHAATASSELGSHYIDFVNAAVAAVYDG